MYFLEKFCRICVQTGVPLVDINMMDFDSVMLSEKLEICSKLVITQGSLSSQICQKCVNKLRVSYHFQDMCKNSTKIIQGYLERLTGTHNLLETTHKQHFNFENSELNVVIEHLPEFRSKTSDSNDDNEEGNEEVVNNLASIQNDGPLSKRKQRITKQQRCSLLKQLLTPSSKPKKERDKLLCSKGLYNYDKGGLRSIIDFTRNYEFSFKLDKNSNIESTPLDKLTAFSKNFFQRDFTEFKTHILYIIENRDMYENISCTTDEEIVNDSEGEDVSGKKEPHFEEVIVEPDIKIKSEIMDCEDEESNCPLDYLETSFEDEDVPVKKEACHSDQEIETFTMRMDYSPRKHSSACYDINSDLRNKMPAIKSICNSNVDKACVDILSHSTNYSINDDSSHSVKLLDKLVSSYPISSRKGFSPNNVRCRTRNNPYINPLLKDQFLFRSFKCERCNRYFKSQGYLKAHNFKVH